MLATLKRVLFAARPGVSDTRPIAEWALRQGLEWKRARGGEGFVIEGALDAKPWRLEWGPPQRDFTGGRELRLRAELGLPSSAQMLVLTRELMATLERRTFEDFTDTLQTQAGMTTPEEMRWLVVYPKVDLAGVGHLRQSFGVVAATPARALDWIGGALAQALEHATASAGGLLHGAPPFVLMTLKGRVYLRMRLDAPTPETLAEALALFDVAVTEAVRAVGVAPGRSEAAAIGAARTGV